MYVSIFIALAFVVTDYTLQDYTSEGKHKVHSLFEFMLQDQSSEGKCKVHSHFDCSLESRTYTLKSSGSMWGPSCTRCYCGNFSWLAGPGGVPRGVSGWKAGRASSSATLIPLIGRTNNAKKLLQWDDPW